MYVCISFKPDDERRSCNMMEIDYFANCIVFVSLAHKLFPVLDKAESAIQAVGLPLQSTAQIVFIKMVWYIVSKALNTEI